MLSRNILASVGLSTMALCLSARSAIAAPVCAVNNDFAEIMPQLLSDLPSYSNRVIQRARKLEREEDTYSHVLEAGGADFQPLALKQQQFTPQAEDTTEQVFFATLDRQYINDAVVTLEQHHWLFVTPSSGGWSVVHLLSAANTENNETLIIPPRISTSGSVGKAIQLWLRDYNAYCAN